MSLSEAADVGIQTTSSLVLLLLLLSAAQHLESRPPNSVVTASERSCEESTIGCRMATDGATRWAEWTSRVRAQHGAMLTVRDDRAHLPRARLGRCRGQACGVIS